MKEAFLLWRLVRLLKKNRVSGASAAIQLVQEKEEGATYRELVAAYEKQGLQPPPPRQAVEVTVWKDISVPSTVHRGHDLAEALANALGKA